jgi:hypothetical protein
MHHNVDMHKMQIECQYCVLLPKLQNQDRHLETTDAEAKKNIYTLIESEWNVIQPDGSMDVPKIQGHTTIIIQSNNLNNLYLLLQL